MNDKLVFQKSSYSGQAPNCVEVAALSPPFRKSSHSGVNGDCVEATDLPASVALRDSKYPDAGYLAFPAAEWDAFLTAAQTAEL